MVPLIDKLSQRSVPRERAQHWILGSTRRDARATATSLKGPSTSLFTASLRAAYAARARGHAGHMDRRPN